MCGSSHEGGPGLQHTGRGDSGVQQLSEFLGQSTGSCVAHGAASQLLSPLCVHAGIGDKGIPCVTWSQNQIMHISTQLSVVNDLLINVLVVKLHLLRECWILGGQKQGFI